MGSPISLLDPSPTRPSGKSLVEIARPGDKSYKIELGEIAIVQATTTIRGGAKYARVDVAQYFSDNEKIINPKMLAEILGYVLQHRIKPGNGAVTLDYDPEALTLTINYVGSGPGPEPDPSPAVLGVGDSNVLGFRLAPGGPITFLKSGE